MKIFKILSKKLFQIESAMILAITYILLVPIFFLINKIQKSEVKNFWLKWEYKSDSLEDLRKQY